MCIRDRYETGRPIWPTANTQSGSIWNPIAEFLIFMLLSAGWMKTERLTTVSYTHLVKNLKDTIHSQIPIDSPKYDDFKFDYTLINKAQCEKK